MYYSVRLTTIHVFDEASGTLEHISPSNYPFATRILLTIATENYHFELVNIKKQSVCCLFSFVMLFFIH